MLCEFSSVIRAKAIEERSFIGLGGLTRQSFFVGRGGCSAYHQQLSSV